MQAFTGRFYCVTNHSTFQVTVPEDLCGSPEVMKMATNVMQWEMDREMKVPVGGIFRYGYFIGITTRGLFKYNTSEGPQVVTDLPPSRFEELPSFLQAKNVTHTKRIIGLFQHRHDADDCLAEVTKKKSESFDLRWYDETRQVLLEIGLQHPLISISTERKFAVPQFLYDTALSLPE